MTTFVDASPKNPLFNHCAACYPGLSLMTPGKCEPPFGYVPAAAMSRSRNPPQKGQGAARAKQVKGFHVTA